jgi:hypothetical protein
MDIIAKNESGTKTWEGFLKSLESRRKTELLSSLLNAMSV